LASSWAQALAGLDTVEVWLEQINGNMQGYSFERTAIASQLEAF
jgi:hypothetical protein